MFSSVDIEVELLKARQKHAQAVYNLMQQIEEAKKKGTAPDDFIVKRLRDAAKPGRLPEGFAGLDKNKVFSDDDIKNICIQYRLRFLDGQQFKMKELPGHASTIIERVEKELGKETGKIKVVAPVSFFKTPRLNNEPLIFVQLDEHNYYLVHKWNIGLSWTKKILAFPMRSIWSLLICLTIIGLPIVFVVPAILFHSPEEVQYYQSFYMAAFFITAVFVTVFGGFSFYKSFSRACWNRYYFN